MRHHTVILLIIFTTIPVGLFSQVEDTPDRIATYKIAFFTRRLNLTPGEAEKFWPVYNDFEKKKIKVQQERASILRNINRNEHTLSDAELTDAGDRLIGFQVEEAKISKELHEKLKEILSPAKVLRVYQTENMFRTQLLNDLRENRQIRRLPR